MKFIKYFQKTVQTYTVKSSEVNKLIQNNDPHFELIIKSNEVV
jgi:hypothetical protein